MPAATGRSLTLANPVERLFDRSDGVLRSPRSGVVARSFIAGRRALPSVTVVSPLRALMEFAPILLAAAAAGALLGGTFAWFATRRWLAEDRFTALALSAVAGGLLGLAGLARVIYW